MSKYRKLTSLNSWFVLIVICFILTLLDIIVVESYYRPSQAWDRIWVWHMIYRTIFIITPLVGSYFSRSLVPLVTLFFFLFGLEDTLFYALQGYLPLQYSGISVLWFWEPSLNLVLQMNFLGLTAILLFGIFTQKTTKHVIMSRKTFAYDFQQLINSSLEHETVLASHVHAKQIIEAN